MAIEINNFDPDYWEAVFRAEARQSTAGTGEEEGAYGSQEDVEREAAGQSVEAPVRARRGLRETWDGMSRADRLQAAATIALVGVIGVEAAWLAREAVVPGVENLADGFRTFVRNGTCGGGKFMETCGNTSFSNIVARMPGAIVDWATMPWRFFKEMRTGDGIPSMEVTAKTIALIVEEYNFGAFRETLGRGIGGGIRLLPAFLGVIRPRRTEEVK